MRDVQLRALFSPKAIAVIGTFDSAGAAASVVLSNLERWGYQGRLVPVNWIGEDAPEVELPHGMDLAVVCLEPERVPTALEWAAEHGV